MRGEKWRKNSLEANQDGVNIWKKPSEYWMMIKWPVVVYFVLVLLHNLNFWILNRNLLAQLFFIPFGLFLPIYVGWNCVKSFKCGLKQSAVAGGIYGLVNVFFGLAMTFIAMALDYNIFDRAIEESIKAGSPVNRETLRAITVFTLIVGAILTPLFTAFMSLLGAFAAQKFGK
ncbi:MAG: hypothetical protein N3G22_01795 [Candidatus Micrarchaeota archaeon]|nr:hypothetical protein [Candidatus Micrarchaeota archaeon]